MTIFDEGCGRKDREYRLDWCSTHNRSIWECFGVARVESEDARSKLESAQRDRDRAINGGVEKLKEARADAEIWRHKYEDMNREANIWHDKYKDADLQVESLRKAAQEKLDHDQSPHYGGRCAKCFAVDRDMAEALKGVAEKRVSDVPECMMTYEELEAKKRVIGEL